MKKIILVVILLSQSVLFSENNKHNLLWVIDNSQSMKPNREEVVKGFQEMAKLLLEENIPFQLGVTTTDVMGNKEELVSSDGVYIINSNSVNPGEDFKKLLSVVNDSSTSFWEQGLEASLIALKGAGKFLLEPNVPLSIIYVSDEDDYSCKENCYGVQPEDNPYWVAYPIERYAAYFSKIKQKQKIPVSIYPVVSMSDSLCSVASLGQRYRSLQESLQVGFTSSICPAVVKENIIKIAKDIISQANKK